MNKPTLKEVKKYFKYAKTVRCLQDNELFDITECPDGEGIHSCLENYLTECANGYVALWRDGKYAEILSTDYKDYSLEESISAMAGYIRSKILKGEFVLMNITMHSHSLNIDGFTIGILGFQDETWQLATDMFSDYSRFSPSENKKITEIMNGFNLLKTESKRLVLQEEMNDIQKKLKEL